MSTKTGRRDRPRPGAAAAPGARPPGQRAAHRATGLDHWWRARGPREKNLIIAGVYAFLTVVFFAPFIFSDRMLFGTDIIPMGYAARKIYADFLRIHHALPLWNPYILGGLPFAEALHGDIFYPASLLYLVFDVHRAIGMKLVLHVFIAGIAMFAYLRSIGLRRAASMAGGTAYMFAPYFISLIYAGHDAKMYVTALFPFLLAALESISAGKRKIRAILVAGAVVGLMLLSSHVQMAYFALWGAGLYTLGLLIRARRAGRNGKELLRLSGSAALAVGIGLAVGLVQLLPPYLYTKTWSPRAGGVEYSFASSWSLHPEEAVSLVLPEFGGYQDSYWGRNPFKLNIESPGTLVFVLALFGLAGSRRRWPAIPATGIAIFALLYALGAHTPLHRLFYAVVPGVKFFRAPSIIMFLFSWGVVTLAALAMERFLEARGEARTSKGGRDARSGRFDWRSPGPREFLLFAGAWWGVFAIAALARAGGFNAWTGIMYRDISPQNRQVMEANVSNVLAGLAIAGVLLVIAALVFRSRDALGRAGATLALTGLIFVGSARIDRHFVKPVALTDYIKKDQLVETLEREPGLFRVLPVTGESGVDNNYFPVFGIHTANGFHDNRMASYDLILRTESGLNPRQLQLLNVKYVVTGRSAPPSPEYTEVAASGVGHLLRINSYLDRAQVVHRARVLEDPAALRELLDGDMLLDREIILSRDAGVPLAEPPAESPPETVEVVVYNLRETRFRVRAYAPGFFYLGDNYYPAWHAFVDGVETPVHRANLTFRAVPISAGEHEITFRYHAPVLARSMTVSLITSSLLIAALIGEAFLRRRRVPGGGDGDGA